jgi:hypothetical protein
VRPADGDPLQVRSVGAASRGRLPPFRGGLYPGTVLDRCSPANKEVGMFFHVRRAESPGLLRLKEDGGKRGARAAYEFSPTRAGLGLLAVAIIGGFMLACKAVGFDEGATAMLHLLEVIVGGLVGLLFGERVALQSQE